MGCMWSGLSAWAMSAAPSMATPTVATDPAAASSAKVGFFDTFSLEDEEKALLVPVRAARANMRENIVVVSIPPREHCTIVLSVYAVYAVYSTSIYGSTIV